MYLGSLIPRYAQREEYWSWSGVKKDGSFPDERIGVSAKSSVPTVHGQAKQKSFV